MTSRSGAREHSSKHRLGQIEPRNAAGGAFLLDYYVTGTLLIVSTSHGEVRKGQGFFIRMLIGNYSLTIYLSSASLRTREMFNPWLELSLKAVQMGMEAQLANLLDGKGDSFALVALEFDQCVSGMSSNAGVLFEPSRSMLRLYLVRVLSDVAKAED